MSSGGRILYGPPVYFPILGEEGGKQRIQLGYYRVHFQRFSGFYAAVRIRGRWFRLSWQRKLCRG